MAKTKAQTVRHLFNCQFTDDEWNEVLEYCKEHNIKGAHRALSPKSKSTFQQFIEWIDDGFGVGDVVCSDGAYCIIGDTMPEHSYAIAMIKDGMLTVGDFPVAIDHLERASEEQANAVWRICYGNGYRLNESLAKLIPPSKLKRWERVKVEKDKAISYGIVDNIISDGVIMTFLVDEHRLKENVQLGSEYSIVPVSKEELLLLDGLIADNGCRWNQRRKCLEPNCERAGKGKTYWYISDVFTVKNGTERDSVLDRMRFQVGNYFLKNEDAVRYLFKMIDLRRLMLSDKKDSE